MLGSNRQRCNRLMRPAQGDTLAPRPQAGNNSVDNIYITQIYCMSDIKLSLQEMLLWIRNACLKSDLITLLKL